MRTIPLIIISLALLLPATAMPANSERNFGGVGIDGVPLADGRIVVRQLVYGGPAHRAGIMVGDLIVSIDSKPTAGSDFRQMVDHRLRGKAGTTVLLMVSREGTPKPLRFVLRRQQLQLPASPPPEPSR
jgi:C-terminal processing protease CtpA/Prc